MWFVLRATFSSKTFRLFFKKKKKMWFVNGNPLDIKNRGIEMAIKSALHCVDRKSKRGGREGGFCAILIGIQESVEIMKGADWPIVRNNTVHRRRLDRFPHGGSRFTAQFSPAAPNCQDTIGRCVQRPYVSRVWIFSFHCRYPNLPRRRNFRVGSIHPSGSIIFDRVIL